MALASHHCTFCISNWNEETTTEFPDGSKLTRASVSQAYDGDMAGTSTVEYLMTYLPSGSVKFIGFEVLTGSIGGRSGTVVMQHDGLFVGGRARSTWSFVEDSGTGELINLHGNGSYES
ncbi:MAG TPA: DUF3224 domain-containing protein, partial [Thermomicrobiales bacterium]|nr:DUF3224 domain-containing protein [Thermomicrobiales bacterium]